MSSKKNHLNIYINDDRVEFVKVREDIDNIKTSENSLEINEDNIFEGIVIKDQLKVKQEEPKIEEGSVTSKILKWNQGLLLYYGNRLIRRFENPKLGNLDFLSSKSGIITSQTDKKPSLFDLNGYIRLKNCFKPNIFKTEVENPYYSNYLYTFLSPLLQNQNDVNVKRKVDDLEELDAVNKKIKTN